MSKYDEQIKALEADLDAGQLTAAAEKLRLLQSKASHLSPRQQALCLFAASRLAGRSGDKEGARQHLNELYTLAKERHLQQEVTKALHHLGLLEESLGNYKEAIADFRHELRLWSSTMDDYFLAISQIFLEQGICFSRLRDQAEAGMYFSHARSYAITARSRAMEGRALRYIAAQQRGQGKRRAALKSLQEALAAFKEESRQPGIEAEIEQTAAAIATLNGELHQISEKKDSKHG